MRVSASVTPVQPAEREVSENVQSSHTPSKISGRPRRVSASNSPLPAAGTPGSIHRRAAKRASSGLAVCSLRAPQFLSPSEGQDPKDGSSGRGGSGARRAGRICEEAEEEANDEDDIAKLLALHNSKVEHPRNLTTARDQKMHLLLTYFSPFFLPFCLRNILFAEAPRFAVKGKKPQRGKMATCCACPTAMAATSDGHGRATVLKFHFAHCKPTQQR